MREQSLDRGPWPVESLEGLARRGRKIWVLVPSYLGVKPLVHLLNRGIPAATFSRHPDVWKLCDLMGWEQHAFQFRDTLDALFKIRNPFSLAFALVKLYFPFRFALARTARELEARIGPDSDLLFITPALDLTGLSLLARLRRGRRLYFSSSFRATERSFVLPLTPKRLLKKMIYGAFYGFQVDFIDTNHFESPSAGPGFFRRHRVILVPGIGGCAEAPTPKDFVAPEGLDALFLGEGSESAVDLYYAKNTYRALLAFVRDFHLHFKEHPGAIVDFLGDIPLDRTVSRYTPAEWLAPSVTLVMSVSSPVLTYYAKRPGVRALCLAHLVTWKEPKLRDSFIEHLRQESGGKILFLRTFDELREQLGAPRVKPGA